jgi:uncharacterized protein (TIGR02466 family)
MKPLNVLSLFPTPVVQYDLDRPFTEVELSFFKDQSSNTHKNTGNTTTNDSYVLNKPEMADLAKDLLSSINYYVANIINPVDGLTPYITQSWINYTEPGEFHHKHKHPNSIISGVLYINADEKKDKILFFNNFDPQIEINTNQYNLYNARTWWVGVKTGALVLFPSHLYHMVETTETEETRISLAFNVFFSGNLGNEMFLTELKIS